MIKTTNLIYVCIHYNLKIWVNVSFLGHLVPAISCYNKRETATIELEQKTGYLNTRLKQ